MLMRPSNICNEAPSGAAGFAVVEPPPFFQGVVRQSLARTIFNAGLSSAQARQIEVVCPRAIDGDVVAGIGMSHHASGGRRSHHPPPAPGPPPRAPPPAPQSPAPAK